MLQVKIYKAHEDANYRVAYGESQGIDIAAIEDIKIPPLSRVIVPTGLHVALPMGTFGLLKERSSMAVKRGIMTMAGVIDNSYRGEIKVVLFNTTGSTVHIQKGEFFAQLLVIKVVDPAEAIIMAVDAIEKLGETQRGAGRFGSSDEKGEIL